MKVVVTGASGFLGQHIVTRLRSSYEHEVVGVSRRKIDGLVSVADYKEIPSGDILIHLAEENSRAGANVGGAKELVRSLRTIENFSKCSFSRIIYSSSAVLYGDKSTHAHKTSDAIEVNDDYSKLKLSGEQEIMASGHGMSVRLSNLYGPGMNPGNVVSTILRQAEIGEEITVEALEPIRDFLWAEDAATAILRIALSESFAKLPKILNIGTGVGSSIREIAEIASRTAGWTQFNISARSISAPSCIILNIDETIKQLDWHPTVDIHAGLARLLHNEK